VRSDTHLERRRLYLLARVLVKRHYRRRLTLKGLARALSCSPRQLQRVYAEWGESTFHEDLTARRMAAAAQLLAEQPLSVCDVARLVGYSGGSCFAHAFRRHYGISPARFRASARRAGAERRAAAGRAGEPRRSDGRRGVGQGALPLG